MNFKIGDTYFCRAIPVGTKIKFKSEKQKYTIMASNRFYSICTKPFNAQKTVLYSIISWFEQIRGRENLVFGMGAETKKDCEEMLDRLTLGETEVSSRHFIKLDIESYKEPKF